MKTGGILLSLLTGLTACGCTSVEDPFLTSAIAPASTAISSEVSPDLAVAALPSISGTAVSVRQTVREDYLKQTIVYPNRTALAGENALTVEAGRDRSKGRVALRAPSRRRIEADMREALPGVAMRIADSIDENAQGVYGYASGALASGGSCIYAWQVTGQGKRMAGAGLSRPMPARITLRYCDPAIPQDRIGAMMQGMRLKPLDASTLAMLRAQSGPGLMAVRPVPVVPESNEPVIDRPVAMESVPATQTEQEAEPAIANAARIPLPSGGTASEPVKAKVDEAKVEEAKVDTSPAPVLRNSVSVPLPD